MEKTVLNVGFPLVDDMAKLIRDQQGLVRFLKQNLGQKKLLVIRSSGNEKEIRADLEAFSMEEGYVMETFKGDTLQVEDLKKLSVRQEVPLLVVIENLSLADRLEILEEASLFRALLDLADPGNEEHPLSPESAFVFLAEETFPSAKLSAISLTWAYESAFYDGRAFREKVLTHMTRYREKFLHISEETQVLGKKYGHILPEKHYHGNFLGPVREDLIISPYLSGIHWHRFSHHLNSAQVLGVNFIYPLIRKQELESLLRLLGMEGNVTYDPLHLSFAKLSGLEQPLKRKSCFDFHMALSNGEELYVLSNYTDGCFGRADQELFSEKYAAVYEPLLAENTMIRDEFRNEDFFQEEYRYMRSLLHLSGNTRLLVLLPRENYALREKALFFRDEVLTEEARSRFLPVIWEELLEAILVEIKDPETARYYEVTLKDKYFRY